jgi:four helix bundle protein
MQRCGARHPREAGFGVADYKKLLVWQKAHALALNAHRAAGTLRGSQYAALRSQIIRAAFSIPANIVEGREQRAEAGFARYLRIALGSTSELDYHLGAARDIGGLGAEAHALLDEQVVEVRMMLHGLLRRLEPAPRKSGPSPPKSATINADSGTLKPGSG